MVTKPIVPVTDNGQNKLRERWVCCPNFRDFSQCLPSHNLGQYSMEGTTWSWSLASSGQGETGRMDPERSGHVSNPSA